MTITFTAAGGSDHEVERAKEKLTVGQTYEIENAIVGPFYTSVIIKGASYNSCLFDVDIGALIDKFGIQDYIK